MTLALSEIVAGCWRLAEWRLDVPARLRWIEAALDLGITSFDHADLYGGYGVEALFGEALAASPGLRQRLQIVTKCGIRMVHPARPAHRVKSYDTSRAHVVASVDASLAALRTDRIDLLLIHRPDWLTDPDELAGTFRDLQAAGKVLAFGVSNHAPDQFSMLHRRIPLATNQIEFSPLALQALSDGTLTQATDLGLRPMAWSPLARGRLFDPGDAHAARLRALLEDLGRPHGVGAATMAYAWVRRHPSRPRPITGTGRIDGMREAAAALNVPFSAEDWYAVWQTAAGREVP